MMFHFRGVSLCSTRYTDTGASLYRQSRFQKLGSIWLTSRKRASINYSGYSLYACLETVIELERMRIIKPEPGFSVFVV